MSAETQLHRLAAQPASWRLRWPRLRARVAWRFLTARFFSSLTRRIVVLNLGGLVGAGGRLPAPRPVSRRPDPGASTEPHHPGRHHRRRDFGFGDWGHRFDHHRSGQALCNWPGESVGPTPSDEDATQFSINPALVGPFLHRLVTPTRTRARIYDSDGPALAFDPARLHIHPRRSHPVGLAGCVPERRGLRIESSCSACEVSFVTSTAPRADDPWATNGRTMPEVAGALQGKTQSLVRVNREGETVVSVGVPIQHMMATRGALLLSTQGGDIDRADNLRAPGVQLRFFLVLAIVMLVLSLSARQYDRRAGPARLADAAERVRRGIRARDNKFPISLRAIPNEIGHLSRAAAISTRRRSIIASMVIESFAADVAHELKNPLDVAAERSRNAAQGEHRSFAATAPDAPPKRSMAAAAKPEQQISDILRCVPP